LGCTYDAVRQKWAIIRRELVGNNPTPPATPQKRKPKAKSVAKEVGGNDHLDECCVKVEKSLSEDMTGIPTPYASGSPNKRKATKVKSAVKVEDSESDGEEYGTVEERSVKKARIARGAALKAADKIKKDYEMPWEIMTGNRY
jgi:hypothetical protein